MWLFFLLGQFISVQVSPKFQTDRILARRNYRAEPSNYYPYFMHSFIH